MWKGRIEMNLKKWTATLGAALVLAFGALATDNIAAAREKKTDFSVVVLQKTGNDARRNIWLFFGDGYTQGEQEKFLRDVRERVDKMMLIEPYKSYKDAMNIYAIEVVSCESGSSRAPSKDKNDGIIKDTYLGVHQNSVGIERLGWFSPVGEKRLEHLIKQLERNYLDKGGKVMQNTILANSTNYFGGGALRYGVASLAAGEAMVVHEASHGFADLADEYNESPQDGPNKTKQTDLKKVPWREFFGFRDIELFKYGKGAQKPANNGCIMDILFGYKGYCEVCKEHVASILNKGMKQDGHPYYMAEPSLTLYEADMMKTGKTLSATNLCEAKGRSVQLRTVVRNYTDLDEKFVLHLTVRDKNLRVKYKKEQSFVVAPGKLKSLALVTEKLMTLEQGNVMSWFICEGDTRKIVRKGAE